MLDELREALAPRAAFVAVLDLPRVLSFEHGGTMHGAAAPSALDRGEAPRSGLQGPGHLQGHLKEKTP